MASIPEQLARRQITVARTNSFKLDRPDAELRRLAEQGTVLLLTKGFYALIPEDRRGAGTHWRPTIEGVALGIAAAIYGANEVALIGPSAARSHRCYPRSLGSAYIAVPKQHRHRNTVLGEVRFVTRDMTKMDTVRIETDLGPGWATSPEQTALDLCRNRPAWNLTEEARTEMVHRLADRIDWDLIDQVAMSTRGVKTLHRLRGSLGRANS